MSVDRGYLGRTPGQERDSQIHRSMDDLTFQKTKGLELVRLLRVSTHLHRMFVNPAIVISFIFKFWNYYVSQIDQNITINFDFVMTEVQNP